MNQPSPEQMEQMMGQQEPPAQEQTEMPQEQMQDPNVQQQMQGMDGQQMSDPFASAEPQEPQEPQAMEMLNEVILQYMDYAIGIKNDAELDQQVKSKIMAEQASAISSLVPLLTNNGEMEMAKMRHEMDLKYQEHEMDMQIKQQELEMKKEEN